jgi:uncharacterized coiled-coil DUF342 family protein
MTTTEGHDMPEPMTDARLAEIRDNESRNLAKLFDSTITELLAEVDRLRAQVQQYHRSADEHVAKFDRQHKALMNATREVDRLRRENLNLREMIDAGADRFQRVQAEVERMQAELKTAKSTRFENNGVGDVAKHIQAETINDLRLN